MNGPHFIQSAADVPGHPWSPLSFWNSSKRLLQRHLHHPPAPLLSFHSSNPGQTPVFARRRKRHPSSILVLNHFTSAQLPSFFFFFTEERKRKLILPTYMIRLRDFLLSRGGGRANVRERQRHSKHHEKGPGWRVGSSSCKESESKLEKLRLLMVLVKSGKGISKAITQISLKTNVQRKHVYICMYIYIFLHRLFFFLQKDSISPILPPSYSTPAHRPDTFCTLDLEIYPLAPTIARWNGVVLKGKKIWRCPKKGCAIQTGWKKRQK